MDIDGADSGNRVTGVEAEVGEDLFDLGGVDEDMREVVARGEADGDIFAEQAWEDTEHFVDELIELDVAGFDGLAAGEGEELSGEFGGAGGGFLDGGQVVEEIFVCVPKGEFGMSKDNAEHIIEVVSDASGQASDGIETESLL